MHEWKGQQAAASWDASGGGPLPTRAEQQAILLALLAASETGDGAMLDLGIGSGLVAEAVLDAQPSWQLVGVDFSDAMLELARERLSRFGSRVLLVAGDLSEPRGIALPSLSFRAAFSVQTIHHLSDIDKAAVFAWLAALIEPGGLIVIIDRVRVEEPLFRDWAAVWRKLDPRTPETYAEHAEELRRAGDQPALLQDQLAWMEEAGLVTSCLHLYGNRAVIVGRKPEGESTAVPRPLQGRAGRGASSTRSSTSFW